MQATINVKPPSDLVHTLSRDLILDEGYSGKLYLKGIKVSLADSDERAFHMGYNLMNGILSRDRDQFINPEEESKMITEIWSSAIEGGNSKALSNYVNLLRHYPLSRDVRMAERLVTESTAKKVWGLLLDDAKANGVFYYPEGQGDLVSSLALGMI